MPTEMNPEGEAQLMERTAARDQRAFAQLFRGYQRRLIAFFWLRTHDREATAELFQETMITVWQRARTFNGHCKPSTWVLGIAYRKALEWHRARHKLQLFSHDAEADRLGEPSTGQDLVQAQAGREELCSCVRRALAQLPEAQRAAIELTFEQGLSYREIAEVLGCSPGTVKSRIFYAKRTLKEILQGMGLKGDELWQISRGS